MQSFKAFRGVTQGKPLSPRLFKIMMDTIVWEWRRQVMGPEAAVEGVGLEIRKLLTCFYMDDRVIALRDLVFLQECIDKLAALFDRVSLVTNTTKTEAMTFLPGNIRG